MNTQLNFEIPLLQNKVFIYAFIASMFSYFFVYGFEITHFTFSIDEEPMDNFAQTLSAGRWGHALLRHYILPEPYTPFFTLIIALFFMATASALSAIYLNLSKINGVTFVIMLAAIPQMAYQLEFSNQSDTIAISMLCSVMSLLALNRSSAKGYLSFIILTIASLSVYQSIFLYAASLLCVWIAISAIRNEINVLGSLKKIAIFSALTIIALLINLLLTRIIASHYNVMLSSYLSAIVGWGKSDLLQVVIGLVAFIRSYFTFNAAFGMNAFPIIIIPLAAVIIGSLVRGGNSLLIGTSSIAVVVSAFLLNLAIGSGLPPRAMTQVPVVFAGIFTIAAVLFNLRTTAIFISIIFLAVGASSSNKMFYSDYMARKSDDQLSSQIISAIYQKYPSVDLIATPVFFYGSYTPYNAWRIPTADVFGASFFEWDGGNNRRIYNYFSSSNIASLRAPDERQVSLARKSGDSLPSWPNRDSVSLVGGVIIVKLSDKLSEYNR